MCHIVTHTHTHTHIQFIQEHMLVMLAGESALCCIKRMVAPLSCIVALLQLLLRPGAALLLRAAP